MPQLYYGFNNEYLPFQETLDNWIKMRTNTIKIVPVLALYKVDEIDNGAGFGKSEWQEDKNVIDKQINLINSNQLNGYTLFRYDYIVKYK